MDENIAGEDNGHIAMGGDIFYISCIFCVFMYFIYSMRFVLEIFKHKEAIDKH